MSEDDRAAKAARAKAMLKKRQAQKKKEEAGPVKGNLSPTISRTSSPAPVTVDTPGGTEPNGAEGTTASPQELLSLPAAPSATASPDHAVASTVKAIEPESVPDPRLEEYQKAIEEQKQTINLLVSEKATLSESLGQLQGVEAMLQTSEAEAKAKDDRLNELTDKYTQAEKGWRESSERLEKLQTELKAQASQIRDQERELHSTQSNAENLRTQLEKGAFRIRELEEQIQNDDRAEVLEENLRNTQDRAEDLSFQLSKLKQSYEKLNTAHKQVQKDAKELAESENSLKTRCATLEADLQTSTMSLASLSSERDELDSKVSSAKKEVEISQGVVTALRAELSQVRGELASATSQQEKGLSELKSATRRAEDAEAIQRDLQEEAAGLMRSLDEMRPKIVQLTEEKLNLTEKAEHLTSVLSERDAVVSEMEAALDSAKDNIETLRQVLDEIQNRKSSEKSASDVALAELQRAYDEMKVQLDEALANSRELDQDRTRHRQTAARLQHELDSLTLSEDKNKEDVMRMQVDLEERTAADDEQKQLLSELQQEVEVLRTELASKDDEIARLQRETPTADASTSPSLNDEVQSAVKQEHEFELSAAQSKIRSLETSVFGAEAQARALQKQVAAMEDEIARLRAERQSMNHARRSFSSQRTMEGDRMPPSDLIDRNLPPATQQQRQIALTMLQQRMYGEAESVVLAKASDATNGLSFATSVDSAALRWPQFLDDSHVFWCATCKSPDLIVL